MNTETVIDVASVTKDADALTKAVMFVDVVGSTAYALRHGDERWRSTIERHARAVHALVRHHGGMVAQFTGDGFMAMFDDAGDAAECAMRLQLATNVQRLIDVRIGIEHGNFLSFGPGWYVGLTLHVASRITDLAGPGEITISSECLGMARRTVALPPTTSQRVTVRGLDAPLTVHSIRGDHGA